MNAKFERGQYCELRFLEAGDIWHLWTNENHPLIFSDQTEFAAGMNIIGIAAKLCPNVKILTFELMTNHIHIVLAGLRDDAEQFFALFKRLLVNYFRGGRYETTRGCRGRQVDLTSFSCNIRKLESVTEVRNVIAYDNRNGYLVSPDESPYSYPWGSNRYYFNPDAKQVAAMSRDYFSIAERMQIVHSHISDKIGSLKKVYGYACPMDFCDIILGESLFQSASQYFHLISRAIESYKIIAAEISESIYYTDDELYSAISSISKEKYRLKINELDRNAKTELAKTMRYDYNASNKQIARILKIPIQFVESLFPNRS